MEEEAKSTKKQASECSLSQPFPKSMDNSNRSGGPWIITRTGAETLGSSLGVKEGGRSGEGERAGLNLNSSSRNAHP